jgi:hypothetical protein
MYSRTHSMSASFPDDVIEVAPLPEPLSHRSLHRIDLACAARFERPNDRTEPDIPLSLKDDNMHVVRHHHHAINFCREPLRNVVDLTGDDHTDSAELDAGADDTAENALLSLYTNRHEVRPDS